MEMILTEPVYSLLILERDRNPEQMFLQPVYLQPKGGDKVWAIVHDNGEQRKGVIRFESQNLVLWSDAANREDLENMILVKGHEGGFLAVRGITLKMSVD